MSGIAPSSAGKNSCSATLIAAGDRQRQERPDDPERRRPDDDREQRDERVEVHGAAQDGGHDHDVLDLAEHEQEHDGGDRERRAAASTARRSRRPSRR